MQYQKNKPLALIGEHANDFIKQGFLDNGFRIILLPADERLAVQVASHADMLIFNIDKNIFCNQDYYLKNKEIFNIIQEYGYSIIPSNFTVSADYPNDVSLNQGKIGKNIFGHKGACAKSILQYAESQGYVYHSIKQGYAKCSTLILNEKALISADSGIISLASTLNIKNLQIKNEINEINLYGYDYGFIGGASTVYEKNVFFFGDISMHTQGNEISKFCNDNGFIPISFGKEKLCDIGGAIILPQLSEK